MPAIEEAGKPKQDFRFLPIHSPIQTNQPKSPSLKTPIQSSFSKRRTPTWLRENTRPSRPKVSRIPKREVRFIPEREREKERRRDGQQNRAKLNQITNNKTSLSNAITVTSERRNAGDFNSAGSTIRIIEISCENTSARAFKGSVPRARTQTLQWKPGAKRAQPHSPKVETKLTATVARSVSVLRLLSSSSVKSLTWSSIWHPTRYKVRGTTRDNPNPNK